MPRFIVTINHYIPEIVAESKDRARELAIRDYGVPAYYDINLKEIGVEVTEMGWPMTPSNQSKLVK